MLILAVVIISFALKFTCTGKISYGDLGVVNKAFGGNLSDEILQEWITRTDIDGDGEIDFGEFLKGRLNQAKKLENGLNDLFGGL